MRRLVLLISVALVIFCYSSVLLAYTLTFDDVPVGQDFSYYQQQYGINIYSGWEVVNSLNSGWGTPQSGTQSVIWNGKPDYGTVFDFGVDGVSEYGVRSVGAYFNTKPGVVLEMRGYTRYGVILATIGGNNDSWHNRYVGINSAADDILYVHIVGLGSPDNRYHFSMDDLTIVPVPEPSSIAVIGFGLVPMAATVRLRRRKG